MTTTAPHTTTDAEATEIIRQIAAGYGSILRSPVLGTPADQGLAYEDVTFPSADGTPLEAWFIPREGSDKLIIANHPCGSAAPACPRTSNPGGRSARSGATTSRSTSCRTTGSCTTPATTC
nr:hypothetical protein GCM10025730_17560 [Promicromonospora thailandica]